jgi:hydroxymethylglutaryl-CoA reductase (NADPH)
MQNNRKSININNSIDGIVDRKLTISESPYLFGDKPFNNPKSLIGNIENYVGMTMIPTGIIGPLLVRGNYANEEFFVPLSTTEGALVASYNRGAKACFKAGGVNSFCIDESVQRCPTFKFETILDLFQFQKWVQENETIFYQITIEKSNFAQLKSVKHHIEGNVLTLIFNYTTGDASGQNMVTFCTDSICKYILDYADIKPKLFYIEGNLSGDKKACHQSFFQTRGKKVISEVILPKEIVTKVLLTTPKKMFDYWLNATLAVVQSGSIGVQGHLANGLAAVFLATGQDVACVAEAAVGITRMELTDQGDLYVSLTLPNLIVGTVGGGTGLPTQKECLEIMNCFGAGNANKYAEVVGGLLLAGEISITAAISAGHFTSAHQKYGRKKTLTHEN